MLKKNIQLFSAVAFTTAILGGACKKADEDVSDQLALIRARLDAQDKKLDQILQRVGSGGGRQAPDRPPQPDPALTYAIPIDNDFVKGSPAAKVTFIEVADFA